MKPAAIPLRSRFVTALCCTSVLGAFAQCALAAEPEAVPGRWPSAKAKEWRGDAGWLVGANFMPSTAINQLEMWQADTFDPETIDRELGWAAGLGMNTMRVFLHDIPWRDDADGFGKRIDQYLAIADKHGIRTLFVLFDGCWHPEPKAGKQPAPRPGVHNSGWVQSPGKAILGDEARHGELKPYVQGILRRYANDRRVLMWDLFNEPDNPNTNAYGENGARIELDPKTKAECATALLHKAFEWAREVGPSQPLTAGVWMGYYTKKPSGINKLMLDNSDIISFHNYGVAGEARAAAEGLQKLGRPVVCTEYMSRGSGSTFETVLPVFKELGIGAYNWGLVDGKSQTIHPWSTWQTPSTGEPDPWFHDVFRRDGTPYRTGEADLIRKLTGKNSPK